jgi:hypothetical protein
MENNQNMGIIRKAGWLVCILLFVLCSCNISKNSYKKRHKAKPCDCPKFVEAPRHCEERSNPETQHTILDCFGQAKILNYRMINSLKQFKAAASRKTNDLYLAVRNDVTVTIINQKCYLTK